MAKMSHDAGSGDLRQRPGTAAGVCVFIISRMNRHRECRRRARVFRTLLLITQGALRITGRLQNVSNVTHVKPRR